MLPRLTEEEPVVVPVYATKPPLPALDEDADILITSPSCNFVPDNVIFIYPDLLKSESNL